MTEIGAALLVFALAELVVVLLLANELFYRIRLLDAERERAEQYHANMRKASRRDAV